MLVRAQESLAAFFKQPVDVQFFLSEILKYVE